MNNIKVIAAVVVILAAAAGAYLSADKPTAASVAPAKTTAETAVQPKLADNRVYVMYVDSCPMCAQALTYLDEKYKDNANVVRADLNTPEGKELLNACRAKFNIKDVVIPLICSKTGYSMGWSQAISAKLEEYIQAAAE